MDQDTDETNRIFNEIIRNSGLDESVTPVPVVEPIPHRSRGRKHNSFLSAYGWAIFAFTGAVLAVVEIATIIVRAAS